MDTATTRLMDAVKASLRISSDYRLSKVMGLPTATVSRWRTGVGHMSTANTQKACELGGFDLWEWNLRIAAEREKGPDGDIYRDAIRDLDSYRATDEVAKDGLFALLTRSGRAAAILAPVLLSVLGVFFPGKEASASPARAGDQIAREYTLCEISSTP